MNERIKELALQASKEAFPLGSMAWMEKFAELIVEECADKVDSSLRDWLHDNSGGTMGDKLKEHFGVEE